jgi:hypothetical protein
MCRVDSRAINTPSKSLDKHHNYGFKFSEKAERQLGNESTRETAKRIHDRLEDKLVAAKDDTPGQRPPDTRNNDIESARVHVYAVGKGCGNFQGDSALRHTLNPVVATFINHKFPQTSKLIAHITIWLNCALTEL